MAFRRGWVLGILVALGVLTLLLRGVEIVEVALRGTHHPITQGFLWIPVDGRLIVGQVSETDFDGYPNPFHQAGLRNGDQLIEIIGSSGLGHRISGLGDYGEAIRDLRRGEPATLIIRRQVDGATRQVRIDVAEAGEYHLGSWMIFWGWALVFPLIAVGTGLFIGLSRPGNANALTASLLLVSFSSYFGVTYYFFPAVLRETALVYQTLLTSFLPYLFMRFFLLFPSPSPLDQLLRFLKPVGLAVSLYCFLLQLYINFRLIDSFSVVSEMESWPSLVKLPLGLPAVMFLLGLLSLFLNTFRGEQAERRRMRILLIGTLSGLLPLVLYAIWVTITGTFQWEFFPLVCATLVLFPLSFAYAVVRHQVMGVHLILRQGLQFALVSRGFLAFEWLILSLLFWMLATPWLVETFPRAWPLAAAVGVSVVLIAVQSLNKRIMPRIHRRFFRDAYNTQQILTDLSSDVRNLAHEPHHLLKTVIDRISDSLYPDQVAIFLQGVEFNSEAANDQEKLRLLRNAQAGFCCHWHRIRSRRESRSQENPSDQSLSLELGRGARTLAAESFIVRYLRPYVRETPETLDVYLDDPRSWAQALVAGETDSLVRERELIEELNTRLIVPLVSRHSLLGFISLGEKLSQEPYSKEDKALLLTVAEQTSIALDYAHLIDRATEQEKVKRDLEIAKEVQTQLFPQTYPFLPGLQYTGICHPAQGVGGDYYDFLSPSEGQLYLALGDISGKGISAALLMASLQALLRSQVGLHGAKVHELIAEINRLMCSSTTISRYATFFCALYQEQERTLTYVNAGHAPPMLFRPDNPSAPMLLGNGTSLPGEHTPMALDRIDGGEMIRLEAGGVVVGMFPQAVYHQETIPLYPGDVLVTFSDGISEAMNAREEEFGEERLARLIRENIELPAHDLCQLIVRAVTDFAGGVPQHDDMTLVVAKAVG